MNINHYYILLVFLLVGLSCSSVKPTKNIKKPNLEFTYGVPEVQTIVYSTEMDDSVFLVVDAEMLISSFIFKKKQNHYYSTYIYEINVLNSEEQSVISEIDTDSLLSDVFVSRSNKESRTLKFMYPIEPGTYTVNLSFTDTNTDKSYVYSRQIEVPDLNDLTTPFLSEPMLYVIKDTSITPVKFYSIPSDFDTLRLSYTVLIPENTSSIETQLLRFVSDTTIARPLPFTNPSQSDIEFQGINYNRFEVVNRTFRLIQPDPFTTNINFNFQDLPKGNYRAEIRVKEDDNTVLTQNVDFGIVSENFPYVSTARELAEPLSYLMNEDEYKELMSITDDERLKMAVDRFWLSNIKQRQRTLDTIELFYDRVEQSNKLFTNFKEGWKTDRGMMYILFGPPFIVRRNLDLLQWAYSVNLYDPISNFYFRRPLTKSSYFGFENYLVQRSQSYFPIYYQQIEAWLSGVILYENL